MLSKKISKKISLLHISFLFPLFLLLLFICLLKQQEELHSLQELILGSQNLEIKKSLSTLGEKETISACLLYQKIWKKGPPRWPSSLWQKCSDPKGWVDFTSSAWTKQESTQQRTYASLYQKWYAQIRGKSWQKSFSLAGLPYSMALIPPGRFWMGSPKTEKFRRENETRHPVVLSEGFWLGQCEVTQKQWLRVSQRKSWRRVKIPNQDNFPACYIVWDEIEKSFFPHLPKYFRLPTEAQWEYACRAGSLGPYPWGKNMEPILLHAVVFREPQGGLAALAPVGSLLPNVFGVYDMFGNVWEWCQDRYTFSPYDENIDLEDSLIGKLRVVKGGAWQIRSPKILRNGFRNSCSENRYDCIGFRLMIREREAP